MRRMKFDGSYAINYSNSTVNSKTHTNSDYNSIINGLQHCLDGQDMGIRPDPPQMQILVQIRMGKTFPTRKKKK